MTSANDWQACSFARRSREELQLGHHRPSARLDVARMPEQLKIPRWLACADSKQPWGMCVPGRACWLAVLSGESGREAARVDKQNG